MHGFGLFESATLYGLASETQKYEGFFCLEKMHVFGTITYRGGNIYKGYIEREQPMGEGELVRPNGQILKGCFNG